ncbi:MAG: heavy metal translocating P-type ATPase [Erysipelotrichaceae bacterium]|nr:heavy metal translocating P-type ATPase [Erysipelotrichaceae bacterium]
MQNFILARKTLITFTSAILITIGLVAKIGFNNELMATITLIIASILGTLPIALLAYQSLRIRVISIDVLVTIAVVGAFMIKNYEESAIVTFLFLFGAYLEKRTLNKTRSAIKKLVAMAPETAVKQMPNGAFMEVAINEVAIGDILLVKTGAKIPVDGSIINGEGSINEASITGESLPVYKTENAKVFAGTILDNGTIQIVAELIGEETTFGKIIELVELAQDSKSKTERFIDRFAKYYTPTVLLLGFIVWLIFKDIKLAITILVLGCPGALVIGVPVSNVAGIGNGAKHGILLKGSEVINDLSRLDTIVFDKTGTLTMGKPSVTATIYYDKDPDETLSYLASVENQSDHPLAKAVLANLNDFKTYPVTSTQVIKGKGVSAAVNNHQVLVGNLELMYLSNIKLNETMIKDINTLQQTGNSLVITAIDNKIKVIMGVKDELRNDVLNTLLKLRKLGIKQLIILSGDNQATVDVISKHLNLDATHGNMLPEDKAAYIENLIKNAKQTVAFVGDGINDSPSLALAHIGIAMGKGTDVAIETSNVILMNDDLTRLPHALALAKATVKNMHQNIFIAIGVVLFLLAGVFFSNWMNMTLGMLVHEGSILAVIFNGMRLLHYKERK